MKHPMEEYLDKYPPAPDPDRDRDEKSGASVRLRPEKRPVDDSIDLHGMTVEDAERALDAFVHRAVSAGYGKVRIVHGKGTDPGRTSPLRALVQRYAERNPHIWDYRYSGRQRRRSWRDLDDYSLAFAINDATSTEIVGGKSDFHTVAGNDADIVLPHFP